MFSSISIEIIDQIVKFCVRMIPIVTTKNRRLTGFFSFAKLIENAMMPFLYLHSL